MQWKAEGERILAAHTRQMDKEEALADADKAQVHAIAEFEEFTLCGEAIDNAPVLGVEGAADVSITPPIFKTVTFPFKTTTVATLRDTAKAITLQYTGTKKVLWERIIKSGDSNIIVGEDTTTFTYHRVKAAEGSIPMWIILTPEIVPSVEGIDMATSAQRGFCAPTNKDNDVGVTRSNFCTSREDKIP